MVALLLSILLGNIELEDLLGPNTEVLVISSGCPPCVKAREIIVQLQNEDYDVVIISKDGTWTECMLAKLFRVKSTPTLVIRELGKKPKKVIGLKSEEEYRELISCN